MFDDYAIDTIFGALILIICCFASSGIVILIDHDTLIDQDVKTSIEKRFDLCLLSTIVIERKIMNTSVKETVPLIDYLVNNVDLDELRIDNESKSQITKLFDFYFSRYHFWQLGLVSSDKEIFSIAESGIHSENADTIVLERIIQISGSDSVSIDLKIEI